MNTLAHTAIVPQIQVTHNCNLDCSYCFQDHHGSIMDLSTVEVVLRKTVSYYQQQKHFSLIKHPITVTWHGGEPLLAGIDFFREVIQIQSRFQEVVFENRIQTNGTLMTKALAAFFAEYNFSVGFSLDGPEEIHDFNRRFRRSKKGTFASTMRGIDLYQSYAKLDHIPIIAVITWVTLGRTKEFYNFFKDLHAKVQLDIYDIRCLDFKFKERAPSNVLKLAPSSIKVGQFMIELFDLWFNDPEPGVDLSDLRNEVKMILQPEMDKGDPIHKKRCNFGRTIIDPIGRVYSCDQYINDANTALGNIHADPLEDILDKKARLWVEIKRHIRKSSEKMACSSCEWGRQCAGGCMTCMKYNSLLLCARDEGLPDSRWYATKFKSPLSEMSGETYYCDGLRMFRNHVKQAVEQEIGDLKGGGRKIL